MQQLEFNFEGLYRGLPQWAVLFYPMGGGFLIICISEIDHLTSRRVVCSGVIFCLVVIAYGS